MDCRNVFSDTGREPMTWQHTRSNRGVQMRLQRLGSARDLAWPNTVRAHLVVQDDLKQLFAMLGCVVHLRSPVILKRFPYRLSDAIVGTWPSIQIKGGSKVCWSHSPRSEPKCFSRNNYYGGAEVQYMQWPWQNWRPSWRGRCSRQYSFAVPNKIIL